ncbi:MAG: isoaspartyl peptidase/L-asparaginase [Planctomycetota bacterium]|nr:isoaspartyl peptidase/L-asparaginase [Planctomycetota bacterium]
MRNSLLLALGLIFLTSCTVRIHSGESSKPEPRQEWAIAIHAGAGVIGKDSPREQIEGARAGLREALELGQQMLDRGASGLDTVEAVITVLENNPRFNAGKGAVFTAEGRHELDASIMDGATLGCGGVTGVTTVKNPIRLARCVMEQTRHVLFAAEGAEAFADTQPQIERVSSDYFSTEKRAKSLEHWRKRQSALETRAQRHARASQEEAARWKSTVGCVVLDRNGNLVAGTSTGGMTGKRFGRIGDSPLIGAGTYANNDTCAVSCTGTGEEYIRHNVARDIADRMRYGNRTVHEAAGEVIYDVLQPDDGGVIVVDHRGNIAMLFNTDGMFRGAANAEGRFDIAIWE